jgi:hypothetical protein
MDQRDKQDENSPFIPLIVAAMGVGIRIYNFKLVRLYQMRLFSAGAYYESEQNLTNQHLVEILNNY